MASCPGSRTDRNGSHCNGGLYRCKKCGNVGCDQGVKGRCSNQAFHNAKCLKCGAGGQKELLR